MPTTGEVGVSVNDGTRSLGRDDITAATYDVPVKVYRTDGTPTIFAGLQMAWVDGTDPETGTEFDLTAGAGTASRYVCLTVNVPGRDPVYEFVDITELLTDRVAVIIAEAAGG